MAQFVSHCLQALKAPKPAVRLVALAVLLLLAFVIWWVVTAAAPQQALCQSPCLCRYCDQPLENGRCPTTGDGGCIGCAGACTSPGNCGWTGSAGGCGAVSCGCRGSDCTGNDDDDHNKPVTVTPTPTPPPGCPVPGTPVVWLEIIEPKIAEVRYEPPYPVVVGQDPDRYGFDLLINANGGRANKWKRETIQVCDAGGRYPDDCPDGPWHWECPDVCLECYDDPFDTIQIHMRLADSSLDWLRGELATRYTGAQPREGLPRSWQLRGVTDQMIVAARWHYAPGSPDALSTGPVDPGIHGGRIVGTTKGTPLNPPQVVERAFSVPVHLLDTTIGR